MIHILRVMCLLLALVAAVQAESSSDISDATVTLKNAPTARRLKDKLHDLPSVLDYGALCNTQVLRWIPVAIAGGSTHLTVTNGWFEPNDAGKLIVIAGADAGSHRGARG